MLSFKGKLKLQKNDYIDRKLLLMFMKYIRKGKYKITLDGDTIFVARLYSNFNDWCKKQGCTSKISITNFRKIAEDDIKNASMNFKLILSVKMGQICAIARKLLIFLFQIILRIADHWIIKVFGL